MEDKLSECFSCITGFRKYHKTHFYLFICLFIYLFTYLFIYLFIYLLIYLFIHSFIYLFIYLLRYSWNLQRFSINLIMISYYLEAAVRRCSINRCSSKFHNIQRKTPPLESLFNKAAGLKAYNFIKLRLRSTTLLNRDSTSDVVLWILWSFWERFF